MKSYNENYLVFIFPDENAGANYVPPLAYMHSIAHPHEITHCPLCGDGHYVVVGQFQIDALIDQWVARYEFNPIADVYRGKILEKRRCRECGLCFYNYHLPDSDELYERLSATGKYYPSFRSEYGIVTEIIEKSGAAALLEIGCGNGAFLERIRHIVPVVMGSEYNTAAAQECAQRGLDVVTEDITKISRAFDVICHFEVLEHVFDTKKLMHDTLRLLEHGGRLIIGTPDPDGILSVNGNGCLNLPPHHQFDFSQQTFEYLANMYSLKIVDYQKTELTYRHYAGYVQNLTGMPLATPDMSGFYETQKKYTGHSHVVVFEKI